MDPSQQLPATAEDGLIVSHRARSGQLRELRLVGEEGPQQKIADFISGLSEQRLDPDWDHAHPSTPTCESLEPVSCTCAWHVLTGIPWEVPVWFSGPAECVPVRWTPFTRLPLCLPGNPEASWRAGLSWHSLPVHHPVAPQRPLGVQCGHQELVAAPSRFVPSISMLTKQQHTQSLQKRHWKGMSSSTGGHKALACWPLSCH